MDNQLDSYLKWLKNNSFVDTLKNGVEILSVPFLSQHNDYIEIYIQKTDYGYRISDNSETISTLKLDKINLTTNTRKELLNKIILNFGIKMCDDEIFVETNEVELEFKKHMLLQGISKINDLFIINKQNVESLFNDDIKEFFERYEIGYITDITKYGRSGYPFTFDFALPKNRGKKERFIKCISNLNKQKIVETIFFAQELITPRQDMEFYTIVDDREKKINTMAFDNYGIKTIGYSQLDMNIDCFR